MKKRLVTFMLFLVLGSFVFAAHAETAVSDEPSFDSIMPIGTTSPYYWSQTEINDLLQFVTNVTIKLDEDLELLSPVYWRNFRGEVYQWLKNASVAKILADALGSITYAMYDIQSKLSLTSSTQFYDSNPSNTSGVYHWAAGASPAQAIYNVGQTITCWYKYQLVPSLSTINSTITSQTSALQGAISAGFTNYFNMTRRLSVTDFSVPSVLTNFRYEFSYHSTFFAGGQSSYSGLFSIPSGLTLTQGNFVVFQGSTSESLSAMFSPVAGTLSLFNYNGVLMASAHIPAGGRLIVPLDNFNQVAYERYPSALYSVNWVPDKDTTVTDSLQSVNSDYGSKLNDASSGITSADSAIADTESQFTDTATQAIGTLDFGNNGTALYAAGLDFVADTFMLVWNGSPALSGILTVSLMLGVLLMLLGRGSRLFPHDGGDG